MSFVFSRALGLLNATVLTGDIRVLLVMSNTSADEDEDAEFIDDITTLDEYDGAGYARLALAGESFAVDTANDRFKFTATSPFVFTTLGVPTRQAVGLLYYLHVTDDTDSIPLFYYNGTGFPFSGNGADVTVNIHADGLSYLRNAA